MQVSHSAHIDTFTRDNLPPLADWPEFLFTRQEVHYPASINCAAQLVDRHVSAGAGARRCLVIDTETWTYADLLARSNQIARVLVEDADLSPGNRVLLRGPNNPWLVAAWLGVVKAGGVAVTTMPLLRAGELRTMAEIADLNLAICDHRFIEDMEAAAPHDFQIIPYGGSDQDDLTNLAATKLSTFTNI